MNANRRLEICLVALELIMRRARETDAIKNPIQATSAIHSIAFCALRAASKR